MPFETDGFFAGEMTQWIDEHRAEQGAWFDLAQRFNRYCHSVCDKLEINSSNGQQMLCVPLFLRSLEHYQGMILMLERGMVSPAKALLRCQVEAIFALCAVAKSDEVSRAVVLGDWIVQRKALDKIKVNIANGDSSDFTAEELAKLEARLTECKAEIESKEIVEVAVWWLAKEADMMSVYNGVYPNLSGSVHSNVRDLDRYIETNSTGDAAGVRWGPETTGTAMWLSTGIDMLSLALGAVERLFRLERHQSLRADFEKLLALVPRPTDLTA